jgi:hypothetical protein
MEKAEAAAGGEAEKEGGGVGKAAAAAAAAAGPGVRLAVSAVASTAARWGRPRPRPALPHEWHGGRLTRRRAAAGGGAAGKRWCGGRTLFSVLSWVLCMRGRAVCCFSACACASRTPVLGTAVRARSKYICAARSTRRRGTRRHPHPRHGGTRHADARGARQVVQVQVAGGCTA